MTNIKQIIMTLALLLTAVTGAWAQSSLKVVELEVPADWEDEYDGVTAADLPGFYASTLDEAQKWTGAPAEGYADLIYAFDGDNTPYHIPYENGKADNAGNYGIAKYIVFEKNVKIYYTVEPTEWPLTPDADKKVWTLAKMPASNVELQVEYYPGMLTLPASLTGGKLSVEGLTAPFTKLEVLATWENDNTLLSAAHLPGLKEMTDDEAEKWADAPSGDFTLIYGFDGTKAIMATYKDGKFKSFVSTKDVTLSQLKYESAATEFYYSSEAQMPAGFEKDAEGNIYVAKDTKFTVKATPAEGYHLVGWSDDATNKELERVFTMTDDDLTLTATFSDEFELTFDDVNFKTNANITVKVGDADKTLDQDGKLSVKSGQTVTLTAKQGYKFRSVEAKKVVPVKTFNCAGVELIYEDGDTWAKVIERNPGKIYDDSGWIGRSDTNLFLIEGEELINGNQIITTDKIVDPTATYSWQAG